MGNTRPALSTPPYAGEEIAFLTQHGKEKLIAAMLEYTFRCRVRHVDGFDTDHLGTFTREIPRHGTQIETAVRKARIGMELAGCRVGLASEGAFGPDPATGMMPWDVEMVVLVDDDRELQVAGMAQGPARMGHATAGDADDLLEFARSCDFPNHALVIRSEGVPEAPVRKGLKDRWSLLDAFNEAAGDSPSGQVLCEVDLRAHCNPTRQVIIRKAAENLLERLFSPCPRCGSPGYWLDDIRTGLPCAWCRNPTHEVIADIWACPGCGHQQETERPHAEFADPGHCDACNP